MKELKCPKCGNVFSVDEADYASIVSQVRTAEFDAEVERRMAELHERHVAEQELAKTRTEQSFQNEINKKDLELSDKDKEITTLKKQLETIEATNQAAMTKALAEKDREIAALNSTIDQSDNKMQIAVLEERKKADEDIRRKEDKIKELESEAKLEKREAELHEAALIKQHEDEMRVQKELVDYYKDLKTRMSTKMVGETLEQHCSIEFEQYIRPTMPNAYFDKDNDASDGTKGDFVFRDSDDGVEYISIMFEMKNEMDTTATKHKNEDFLKKLDEDRRKKNCEFAVLVSMLESDNDLYNTGIVNKSHLYPKMYVIRPQFFVPFINLLVQTSRKSLEYRKKLILAQNKEADVTGFENKLNDFRTKFGRHYEMASKKFDDAIKDIDATIAKLQKVREELVGSENSLRLANQDTEDLTIRKLTYRNPTMKAKFDEARLAEGRAVED